MFKNHENKDISDEAWRWHSYQLREAVDTNIWKLKLIIESRLTLERNKRVSLFKSAGGSMGQKIH